MSDWQPIKTYPKDEMFIWAAPGEGYGKWRLGLGYNTKSGKWADAYGAPPQYAVYWHPLPEPPNE